MFIPLPAKQQAGAQGAANGKYQIERKFLEQVAVTSAKRGLSTRSFSV